MSRLACAVVVALAISQCPGAAMADETTELDAKLAFLEARLETQRTHAELWWRGFTAFYFLGMVAQAMRAADASDAAQKADLWVSFAKATGGTMRLLLEPHQGIRGLEPAPRQSRLDDKQLRLLRAERILASNAEHTHAFGPWWAHPLNLAVNGIGAVIVGVGYDDWQQGLISAAVGFGVGELMLFTAPWEADDDLEEYQGRFGVKPALGGGAFQLTF